MTWTSWDGTFSRAWHRFWHVSFPALLMILPSVYMFWSLALGRRLLCFFFVTLCRRSHVFTLSWPLSSDWSDSFKIILPLVFVVIGQPNVTRYLLFWLTTEAWSDNVCPRSVQSKEVIYSKFTFFASRWNSIQRYILLSHACLFAWLC